MSKKFPSESFTHQEHMVRPQHTNPHNTVFGGELMAWVDIAAASAAMRHSNKPVVTASIDAMHFFEPIKIGWIVCLDASVNYASNTSCEVGVRVTAKHPILGEEVHTASAYMTFVALDGNGKPTPMPKIEPQTEVEKKRYQSAIERRKSRLELRERLKRRHLQYKKN